MLFVSGIIAVIALGGILYLFFSPKSSKIQKLAAMIALLASGLTLGICGFILIFGGPDTGDPYAFPLAMDKTPPPAKTNKIELVIFLILFAALLGFIVFIGLREQKRLNDKKNASDDPGKFDTDSF